MVSGCNVLVCSFYSTVICINSFFDRDFLTLKRMRLVLKKRTRIKNWTMTVWVCNNLAQSIRSSLLPSGGFFLDDKETEIFGSPTAPATNSAQEDAQEADEYVSELRRRCEQWNDAPEGRAVEQSPSLLFMIPVLVIIFVVVILST